MALNLALVSTITAETNATVMALTPVVVTLIPVVAAEKIVKINSLYAANTLASGAVKVDAYIDISGTPHYLCKTVSVAAGATTILVTKDAPIYLKEATMILKVFCDVTGMTFTVSYETLA